MTLKCPKCGKELFIEDSGYLSECPFCHRPVQYGTAPKEELPIGKVERHPPRAKVKKPFWPSKEELFWGAGVVALGLVVLIPRCNWLLREEQLFLLMLIAVPVGVVVVVLLIKDFIEEIQNLKRGLSCSKITAFIKQHLVTIMWSFIIALSVLGVVIFKWPEVQVRILVALLVILLSRVLLKSVVVLFGIADMLRDIKEEVCQKKEEA